MTRFNAWGLLRKRTWEDVLMVLAVLLAARLLIFLVQWALRHAAEKVPPRLPLTILRAVPLARLLIGTGVEPPPLALCRQGRWYRGRKY